VLDRSFSLCFFYCQGQDNTNQDVISVDRWKGKKVMLTERFSYVVQSGIAAYPEGILYHHVLKQ
jgi:hypothetical protein